MDNSKPICYFVSGHVDVTQQDFDDHYKNELIEATKSKNSRFVMGNAKGIDTMALEFLIELLGPDNLYRITVYHLGKKSHLKDKRIRTIGGFGNHNNKDTAMTNASNKDIAWVRPEEESRILYGSNYNPNRISGTQHNINRRKLI